jgi:hypothetical protein
MKNLKLAAVFGLTLATQMGTFAGGGMEAKITPLKTSVVVTEVTGKTEYAYDSTGWKTLHKGKVLQPGATVRAGQESAAVLKSLNAPTFIKVSSGTRLHLTLEAPAEEGGDMGVAQIKFLGNTSIAQKTTTTPDSEF